MNFILRSFVFEDDLSVHFFSLACSVILKLQTRNTEKATIIKRAIQTNKNNTMFKKKRFNFAMTDSRKHLKLLELHM